MAEANEKITLFNLFDRDTVLHLRIPFSFYLLPVFWFGISQAGSMYLNDTIIVLIAVHLFIYPASNIYNSYMDRDTGSIGGLEHPPPVTPRLYYASMVFDAAGLGLCLLAGWKMALVLAGYICFSKAYSWYGIRLKKYTYLGWASVMFFQGGYTYLMGNMAATNNVSMAWFTHANLECMLFASLIIGGSYPLTQVYQHDEDGSRGDFTISYRLDIVGTFVFTSVLFAAGAAVALHYFLTYYSLSQFLIFSTCLAPVILYFGYWFTKVVQDRSFADYRHAIWMNQVSAACMVICFSIILYLNNIPLVSH